MSRPSHFIQGASTIQRGDLAALYRSRDTDPLRVALGDMYHAPEIFEHGRETLVAQIKASSDDGREVKLFETRAPAAFYAIEAGGFRIGTGSGSNCARQAAALALDMAAGMLVVEALAPEGEG